MCIVICCFYYFRAVYSCPVCSWVHASGKTFKVNKIFIDRSEGTQHREDGVSFEIQTKYPYAMDALMYITSYKLIPNYLNSIHLKLNRPRKCKTNYISHEFVSILFLSKYLTGKFTSIFHSIPSFTYLLPIFHQFETHSHFLICLLMNNNEWVKKALVLFTFLLHVNVCKYSGWTFPVPDSHLPYDPVVVGTFLENRFPYYSITTLISGREYFCVFDLACMFQITFSNILSVSTT